MDMDQDLEELKGDVDFDFFDDDSKAKSPSPRPRSSDSKKVAAKPPPAPKSPKPDSPVNTLGDSDSVKSRTSADVNGDHSGNGRTSNTSKRDESATDSYSSDSDHSDSGTDSESSTFSDVSSVRSGTRARNRSRSQSSSYSRSPTPERESAKNKRSTNGERDTGKPKPRPGKHSDSSSGESDSDSEYSDRTPSPTPRHQKQSKNGLQTPVHKDKDDNRSRARPFSAHPRRRQNGVEFEAWGREKNTKDKSNDVKHKNKSGNNRNANKNNRSASESDSDMTDVSPLTSPRNSPHKNKRDSRDKHTDNFPIRSLGKTVQYCEMPEADSGRHSHNAAKRGEGETLDLNILMKAVSELEKKKRVKDNTRRVMFAPPKPNERGNYTFSDDRTRVIERENQRLLHEIMKHVAEQREPHRVRKVEPEPVRRPTASAINRQRQQKRIEKENLALLQRLQRVRPTRGMARNEQINEYHQTTLYGVPIAAQEELKTKTCRRSRPSSAGSSMSQRSRSMSSVNSASTLTSAASTVRSSRRPGSAKKYCAIDTRPEWSERW